MMTRRWIGVLTALVCVATVAAACGGGGDDSVSLDDEIADAQDGPRSTEQQHVDPDDPDANLLRIPGAAAAVIGAIVEELGELRVSQVIVYESYVYFDAQDPQKPENFDQYLWRYGGIEDMSPINVAGQTQEDLEAELFPIQAVAWNKVPELVETALTETNLEGGQVGAVFVSRNSFNDNSVLIRIGISGARRNGNLEATSDGTIISIETY